MYYLRGIGYQYNTVMPRKRCRSWVWGTSQFIYVNTTVPYFGKNMQIKMCPICGTSQQVDDNNKGKMVPHKVLHYFLLKPRLKRLYGCRHIIKEMRWHYTNRPNEEGVLRYPTDGKAWKDFDCNFHAFKSEPKNVRLGLAVDCFNPFGNMSLSYSKWLVVLTTYNLPPWI